MTEMHIPPHERGQVRVFDVDLPPGEAKRFAEAAPGSVAQALGVPGLSARHVEVFDLSDLRGLGLRGYLHSGQGVAHEALEPDAALLDGLEGHVALVMSGAFEGRGTAVVVRPPLRWVGTWTEAEAETPGIVLDSGSAKGPADMAEAGAPVRGPRSRGALVVTLALLLLAVVLFLWLAG
ncbi:hypothetical protein [Wenxinia saemankumensis]|uniref:Aspartate carbamoyltransferase catalytic subunit n=1 Tax=Wenxinia saemankumensis TaxID=1447782 RepID=A0A1M6FYM6_9RHOB|nr:hypothetical protein [Wenxinia saemankumensis]SHJ02770.1 hypothetical protein SAMN05444417_2574 [Wenxinia saemankumensis]